MEILDKAYKTKDKKVFEHKAEAEEHEANLNFEREFTKLLKSWMNYYGMEEDLIPIVKRAAADKDKIRQLFSE